MKTGLILFTHNKFKVSRPLSALSGIINFLQTGRLKNKNHLPTHTAVTVVIHDTLYVVDSDNDGLDIEAFDRWKEGRAFNGQDNPILADDSMICSVTTAYFYEYKEWWKRSPLNLFRNRFIDAPSGVDVTQGKPNDIKL